MSWNVGVIKTSELDMADLRIPKVLLSFFLFWDLYLCLYHATVKICPFKIKRLIETNGSVACYSLVFAEVLSFYVVLTVYTERRTVKVWVVIKRLTSLSHRIQ
jgi:hypothetical protein